MSKRSVNLALLAAFAVVSCGNQDPADVNTPQSMPQVKNDRTKPVTKVDSTLDKLVDGAKADLLSRVDSGIVDAADVEVLEARRVTWRSSAMGCPMPDRGYKMVLTPGVLIRLRAAGEIFEYHSTTRGPAFLCEPPGTIETPAPGGHLIDPT